MEKNYKTKLWNSCFYTYLLLFIIVLVTTTICSQYRFARVISWACPMKCPYERGVCFVGNCRCHSGWRGRWFDQLTETISCDEDADCLELSTDRKCSEITKLCTPEEDISNWKTNNQGSETQIRNSIQDEISVCGIAIKCSNDKDWRILFQHKERFNKKYIYI